MLVLCGKKISRELCATVWRTFVSSVEKEPYWRAKFPDRIASFDEIPTVNEKYDPYKIPEVAEGWFKKHGHVVKEFMPYGQYIVHLFHFDDFRTVYRNDGEYPIRRSHEVIRRYREERKHLYDHVGLGPGQGAEWHHLRQIARSGFLFARSPIRKKMAEAMDDLVERIKNNLDDKGEIELLPWLHRLAFESIGIFALNRRLNALSESPNELADKMVEAAARTDEIVALTTMDPTHNYEELYIEVVEKQDFFYSVLRGYIEEIRRDMELEPETAGAAQTLFQSGTVSENDAITVIIDLFQGALQTVPVTALMALYNLARNRDIQAKVREAMLPTKDSGNIGAEGFENSIEAVVWETLRLNPPVLGNGRVIQKNLVLGGYSVPAYTNVILHFQVACRQEENFKDPLKFIPRRGYESKQKINDVFGGSSRACLGWGVTFNQLPRVVAKVTRNFDIFYDGGDIKMVHKLHNRPEKPLILRLKPIEEQKS